MGHKEVTKVLLKAGASLSTVGKHVIKPPVKLRQSTDNFSVNNRHVVIKSSQTTQLYITKVFY
jgi:hypothetical protein